MKPQRHLPPVSDISFMRNEPQELPCQQGQVPPTSKNSSVQVSEMRGTLGRFSRTMQTSVLRITDLKLLEK